jgi:hypothetical protein
VTVPSDRRLKSDSLFDPRSAQNRRWAVPRSHVSKTTKPSTINTISPIRISV